MTLVVKQNRQHPETASLFLKFKDGEEGYIRFIPACELKMIRETGIITRDKRECEAIYISS